MTPSRRVLWSGALALAGAACLAISLASAHRGALPDFGSLPAFSLADAQGRAVTLDGLAGSVWVADFIFTRCAGQCPLMSGRMAELQRAFARTPDLRLVSFTVDPAYDTPERLAAYGQRYEADADRWRFVTGEPQAVLALIRGGFRLAVAEEGTEEEPITHSIRLVLVDRRGHVRGSYEATDERAMARLRDDARQLLGEGG